MKLASLALVFAVAVPAAIAQDSVLTVEKPSDRRERDVLERRMRKVVVDFRIAEDEGPKEIAERLNLFARDLTMFVVKPKDGDSDYASFKLDLKRVNMRNSLSVIQRMSDIRFVFKAGVVMLMHKDDVKELTTLHLYDVRAATFKIKDFPGPRLDLKIGEVEEAEPPEESDNTPSGLTLEKLEEVLRAQVLPDSWGGEAGASLTASNGLLIVRQTERGHAMIRKLLRQLGIGPSGLKVRRRAPRAVPKRVPAKRAVKKAPAKSPAKKAKK